MSSQNNKSVVQQIFAAFAEGDMDTVKSFLHEDVCVYEPESLPYGGVTKGRDAMLELFGEVFGLWQDLDLDIKQFVEEGETVVLLADFCGTGKAGISFKMPLAEVWKVRDGKVYEVRPHYFDAKLMHDAHYGPST